MEDVEQLREALASAKQIEAALMQRLREQDLVLSGLEALRDSDDPAVLFERAFGVLRQALAFQDALVLAPSAEGFVCLAATTPAALGLTWPAGGFFSRIAAGRASVAPDNSRVPEWAQTPAYHPGAGGGVYAPVGAAGLSALLILTHAEHGAFSSQDASLVSRLGLLMSQSLEAGQRRRLETERQAAVQASEAKSRFLANMSHEIRTPLNGVTTVADLLSRTALDPRQQEMAGLIVESGRMLEGLLADVLDFARIEAGQLSVERAPFDLGRAIEAVIRLHAPRAEEKGLDLRLEIAPAARGLFVGDDLRVRQVVSNLVSNAVKFTARGEVAVTVTREDPSEIQIEVRDTGPGFSRAMAERLFSRFEQGDDSITKQFAGAGLGLSISRALARLMDGDVTCEGEPGVGATFRFRFHAEAARPVETAPAAESELAAGGPRILVVEDNPNNQRIVGMVLEMVDAQVTYADNGQKALDAFGPGRFDAVLMDLQMPVMDGLTATRRIREREAAEGLTPTPIVVVSANAMTHHVAEALDSGADAHIAKPIQPSALISALSRAMDPNGAVGAA